MSFRMTTNSIIAQQRAGRWTLLLFMCMLCFGIQAQPTRTEFVNKAAPYPQYSTTKFTCSAKDISLNGWVKSVQQTSTIRRLTEIPSGNIVFLVNQYQYTFDSTGNLMKYIDKELCIINHKMFCLQVFRRRNFGIGENDVGVFAAELLVDVFHQIPC